MAIAKEISYREFNKANPEYAEVKEGKYYELSQHSGYMVVSPDSTVEFVKVTTPMTDEEEFKVLGIASPHISFTKDADFIESTYKASIEEPSIERRETPYYMKEEEIPYTATKVLKVFTLIMLMVAGVFLYLLWGQ